MDADLDWTTWETELATLLNDLSTAQDELIQVLNLKRDRMARSDLKAMDELSPRETELATTLEQCHQRRRRLLEQAQQAGLPSQSIQQLAGCLPGPARADLRRQAAAISSKLRILQHQSLTNWVIAQRSVLHLSQLLEIVATGGRIRPTYDKGKPAHSRGALVDRAV